MFMRVSQIFQRRKSVANKEVFENRLNLTCQAQSTPQKIRILTKVFCTSGLNLVVLAWTGDELSHGQAQNGVNFDFEVKFDLEGQGQSPPKTIGSLTKVFYIYGPNLVILAETDDELSRGQARDWHTDGHTHTQTDAGNDNTRRPKLASGNYHYSDVMMSAMASQITGVSIVCPTVCSGGDQRKHRSSACLSFVSGINRWPMDFPHKWPVTRKMLPFDGIIMICWCNFIWSFTIIILPAERRLRNRKYVLNAVMCCCDGLLHSFRYFCSGPLYQSTSVTN